MPIADAVGTTVGYLTLADVTQPISMILKEVYEPGIENLIHNLTPLMANIDQADDVTFEGAKAIMPIHVGRNASPMFQSVSGNSLTRLTEPGRQDLRRAEYDTREFYGRGMIVGPTAAKTRSPRGSYLEAFDFEMSGLAVDTGYYMNAAAYRDGRGVLATAAGAPVGNDLVVQNPGGFANDGPGTQYFVRGQRVGFVRGAALVGTPQEITAIDPSTNTLTFGGPPGGVVANDELVLVPTLSAPQLYETTYEAEAFGLRALIDDANPSHENVGLIDRDTVPEWRALVFDNATATPVSFGLLRSMSDAVEQAGNGLIRMFLMSHGLRAQIYALLQPNVRFAPMQLKGGFTAMSYDNRALIPDKHCTKGYIYGLDSSAIKKAVREDVHFADFGGSVIKRLDDRDAYQFVLQTYMQFCTKAPNRSAVARGLADPV